MKLRHGLPVAALLLIGVAACGDGGDSSGTLARRAPSNTTVNRAAKNNDVLDFGSPATPADRHEITALITRYYASASDEDGATACSLILSSVAKSVPEDYGRGAGPSYLRGGTTCQAVVSRLFKYLHHRMVRAFRTLRVTQVRLKTRGGYAVLLFQKPPEHEIAVVRQNGTWKVASLLDSELR